MTIPGGMMKESVARLRDSIAASKAAADEVRNAVAAQQVLPVTIEEEVPREGDSDQA